MLAGRVRSGIPRLNDNHKLEACLLSCLFLQRCKKTPTIFRYLQLNIRVLKYAMYAYWLTLLAVSAASFFQAPAAPPLYLVTESVSTINTTQKHDTCYNRINGFVHEQFIMQLFKILTCGKCNDIQAMFMKFRDNSLLRCYHNNMDASGPAAHLRLDRVSRFSSIWFSHKRRNEFKH